MCVTPSDIYSSLTIDTSWSSLYGLLLYYSKYHIQWLKKQTCLETGKHTDEQGYCHIQQSTHKIGRPSGAAHICAPARNTTRPGRASCETLA
jgi:hypothetical protein